MDTCPYCEGEIRGGFEVSSKDLPDGTFKVIVDTTPDRNFIVCDSCNDMRCFRCCTYPFSGYCDACIERYDLYDSLVSRGLITPKK